MFFTGLVWLKTRNARFAMASLLSAETHVSQSNIQQLDPNNYNNAWQYQDNNYQYTHLDNNNDQEQQQQTYCNNDMTLWHGNQSTNTGHCDVTVYDVNNFDYPQGDCIGLNPPSVVSDVSDTTSVQAPVTGIFQLESAMEHSSYTSVSSDDSNSMESEDQPDAISDESSSPEPSPCKDPPLPVTLEPVPGPLPKCSFDELYFPHQAKSNIMSPNWSRLVKRASAKRNQELMSLSKRNLLRECFDGANDGFGRERQDMMWHGQTEWEHVVSPAQPDVSVQSVQLDSENKDTSTIDQQKQDWQYTHVQDQPLDAERRTEAPSLQQILGLNIQNQSTLPNDQQQNTTIVFNNVVTAGHVAAGTHDSWKPVERQPNQGQNTVTIKLNSDQDMCDLLAVLCEDSHATGLTNQQKSAIQATNPDDKSAAYTVWPVPQQVPETNATSSDNQQTLKTLETPGFAFHPTFQLHHEKIKNGAAMKNNARAPAVSNGWNQGTNASVAATNSWNNGNGMQNKGLASADKIFCDVCEREYKMRDFARHSKTKGHIKKQEKAQSLLST